MLDELVANKTRVRILRTLFLYPEKDFSESELQRIASIPQPSVHRNVKPLVVQGILNRRRVGKANLYSLNKDHVLHKSLSAMFERERKLVEELEATILRYFVNLPEVKGVFLFGSIPKGKERSDSDVDILVIAEDGTKHAIEVKTEKIHTAIQNKFGNPVSLTVKEQSELKELMDKPLIMEIKAGLQILSRGAIRW